MTDIPKASGRKSSWIFAGLYALAIILGILNGCCPTGAGSALAKFFSEVFIRLFGFVSIPVIGVTICLTIAKSGILSGFPFPVAENFDVHPADYRAFGCRGGRTLPAGLSGQLCSGSRPPPGA